MNREGVSFPNPDSISFIDVGSINIYFPFDTENVNAFVDGVETVPDFLCWFEIAKREFRILIDPAMS